MANVIEIVIKQSGSGTAISSTVKELGGLDKAASNSIGALGRFGSALGGMATVAGGIVAANIFGKIAEGIGGFVSTGLDAVSSAQQLEVAFGALLTQNNLYQQTTETMTVAVGNLAEMQAEAAQKSDDLAFAQRKLTADINTQNASIQEQKQRIIEMADGLDKNQQVARLQEMEVALEGMNRELADTVTEQGNLTKVTQEYETVSKTTWKQVMDLATAQGLAKDQTKDLLSFVEKLAIVSPFEQEDVEKVTKYAVGAGLGVDATKRFTAAFLDWSAAVGITSVNLDEAAYQFLQIKKAGKITAIDLRQLSTRGLDLAKVIGVEMGMSIEEFNKKAENTPGIFDELIEATIRYSNNTFAGTSEAMSTSIEGFKSTISDLFTQSAKKILRPLVDAISPTISEMISTAASFITGGGMEQIGQQLADSVMAGFSAVSEAVGKVMGAFDRFGARGAAVSILGQLGLEPTQIAGVMGVVDQVVEAIGKITGAFDRFGLKGATVSIMGMLGLDPETIGMIFTAIDTISTKISTLQAIFAQFGAQGAGVSLLSMMGLSSETIALITTSIQSVVDGLSNLATWWTATWPVIQAAALTGWEVLQSIFVGLQTALGPSLTQLQTQFTQVFTQISTLLSSFGISWSDVWGALLTATGIVAAGIGAAIVGIIGVVAGLATGIAGGISAAITMFQGLATNVAGIFTGLTIIFVGWVETFKALLAGDFAGAWEGFKIVLQGAVTFWSNMWGGMITVAVGTLDIITSTISGFVDGIVGFFQGMYDTLVGRSIVPDMINAIVKWFSDLPKKILAGLGDLKKKVTEPFLELSTTIKGELGDAITFVTDDLLPLFIEGFDTVTEGVKNFISSIREAASTLADMVIPDFLQQHSPPPLATALNLVAQGAGNAAGAISGMMDSLASAKWSEIRERVFDLVDDLQDEGHYAAMGYGQSTGHAIKQAFVRAFNQSFEGIMAGTISAAQLEAVTRREAGAYADRVSGNFDAIVRRARESGLSLLMAMQQDLMDAMPAMASTLSGLAGNFAEIITGQIEGFKKASEGAAKLREQLVKLTADGVEKNAEAIKKAGAALADYYKELNRQAFVGLSNLPGTAEDSLAAIEVLKEFLAGEEQTLSLIKEFEGGATTTMFWDRVLAQEELNRLLAEQAERERQITLQKENQQKLSFLQSQVDLLKQGKELGINFSDSIKFGLGASAGDMLAATNELINAMLHQIDTTLQIASPSKVIFKKFRDQIGGAAVRGLEAVRPMLSSVTSAMLDPLANGSVTNSRTTNNYFNQTVNTRAESSSVIGDFRSLQLMAGT